MLGSLNCQPCVGPLYNWMFSSYSLNPTTRNHGTSGDVVFDAEGLVYSISSINSGLITILKQSMVGAKLLEASYGAVTGALPVTVISGAKYCPNNGENIYIAGHSKGLSITGNSGTYNIFLHAVKIADLSTIFTKHWGLDGVNQDDFAFGITINPDGGKILVTG